MQPLLDEISKNYSAAEISTNSGGSAYGISSVLDNKKNIGAVAKMPGVDTAGLPNDNTNLNQNQIIWKNDGIKTVTIGKDSIGIIYKDYDGSLDLTINEKNIAMFYLAFCGFNKINLNQLDSQLSSTKYLVPFARAGGANESGTAESFLVDNYLGEKGQMAYLNTVDAKSANLSPVTNNSESIYSVLNHGHYGREVIQTNETSLETWEAIKSYNSNDNTIPITYLSSGFIKNNYDEIQKNGFKIAKYSSKNIELIKTIDGKYTINNEYNWFRPLNLVLKTKQASNLDESKEFVQWILANMLFENSIINKVFNDLGFLTLTSNQISTMFDPNDLIQFNNLVDYSLNNPNKTYSDFLNTTQTNPMNWNSFWLSDYDLYNLQKQQRDNQKEYYGAIIR